MGKTILSIIRGVSSVLVLSKDENGNVTEEKYPKTVTNEEIIAGAGGKVKKAENAPESDISATEEEQPATITARDLKASQNAKKAVYLAELRKHKINMENERSFAKIEAAYKKLKQEEKK